jgi:heat shock protein HslJ
MAAPAWAEEWRIETVNGRAAEGETRLILEEDGSLSGTTGCNRFQGRGELRDGVLAISAPLATTRMACAGEQLSAQDDALLALLQGEIAMAYDGSGQRLTLSGDNGTMTLAAVSASEENAGRTIFDADYLSVFGISDALNIRAQPTTSAPIVAQLRSGTVVRSGGCEERPDRTWCRLTMIDSAATQGWAAGEYLETATAGLRAGQGVYDQIGRLQCAQASDEQLTDCEFGLSRDADGTVVLVVFGEGGSTRFLTFQGGTFAFADTSQSGGGFDTSVRAEGVIQIVTVDEERYEVPDGLVSGG